jgi:hypothetical protein
MRVAVVTDAISAEQYFPIWHRYYGSQFGSENIFLFSYQENVGEFRSFTLGGAIPIPHSYNDDVRRDRVSELTSELLRSYDIVLRVDVDEFLVPDPQAYPSLAALLSAWDGDYMTAFGFDVMQSPEEPDLDFSGDILRQRKFAYALTAMNKTCVTRTPLKWGRGFHYCSYPPQFGGAYLLHTKRADIKTQKAWNDRMRRQAEQDEFVQKYYSWPEEQITQYHSNRFKLPIVEGEDSMVRTDFNREFLGKIKFSESTKLYEGPYDIEQVNVRIPERFGALF